MLILKEPHDQFKIRDIDSIHNLCRMIEKEGMKVLEIGCWLGDSTQHIGKFIRKNSGELHCVDTFKGSINSDLISYAKDKNIRKIFEENMDELDLLDFIKIHEMSSDEAVDKFKDDYFDLIFIDGDHSYKQIKKDIHNYYPKVKNGGIFCGHDMDARIEDIPFNFKECDYDFDTVSVKNIGYVHVGVSRAVSEVFNCYSLLGKTWWVRK